MIIEWFHTTFEREEKEDYNINKPLATSMPTHEKIQAIKRLPPGKGLEHWNVSVEWTELHLQRWKLGPVVGLPAISTLISRGQLGSDRVQSILGRHNPPREQAARLCGASSWGGGRRRLLKGVVRGTPTGTTTGISHHSVRSP